MLHQNSDNYYHHVDVICLNLELVRISFNRSKYKKRTETKTSISYICLRLNRISLGNKEVCVFLIALVLQ